jgi:hypothetical protein
VDNASKHHTHDYLYDDDRNIAARMITAHTGAVTYVDSLLHKRNPIELLQTNRRLTYDGPIPHCLVVAAEHR